MLFIILAICLVVLTFVLCVVFDEYEYLLAFAIFAVVGAVMITIIVSALVSSGADIEKVEVSCTEIYSLSDNVSNESDFVLGIGGSSSSITYYYYTKTDDGLKYCDIGAENVLLKFDDNPRLVKYKSEFKNKKLSFWFWCISPDENMTVLYIPETSVKANISIRLRGE